jgi:polar amino acid transport system substrate-binding protein
MIAPTLRFAVAPAGTLRVGVNHGNPVLANRHPKNRELRGIAVGLARELGWRRELPVALTLRPFEAVSD